MNPNPPEVVTQGEGRFWIAVHEPGMVPVRKGPWPHVHFARIMREFIAAYPVAYLHVLTIGADGAPQIEHGPEALQMADGRSMGTGRKHNARTREAHRLRHMPDREAIESAIAANIRLEWHGHDHASIHPRSIIQAADAIIALIEGGGA